MSFGVRWPQLLSESHHMPVKPCKFPKSCSCYGFYQCTQSTIMVALCRTNNYLTNKKRWPHRQESMKSRLKVYPESGGQCLWHVLGEDKMIMMMTRIVTILISVILQTYFYNHTSINKFL
ncbi:hypothetical protein WN944_000561 [Citrus x changshan-huyou]|uniref:Uncharacterized protein n=1 Tax=Citrus x changshan-huyou TaxID=2935761 RepID=A0AAP0MD46_9ROSI